MDQIASETALVSLEDEMRSSYIDYAMSVIVGRALPDVRDGLKPVHRRVLYAMNELSNDCNKPYKKSARIVGDVIGKYHPHGDVPIYDTIVRMAQKFSLRYCLVDGQGNFGSIDGDNAAAMRYTEIRMSKICHELLADIDKKTVDFAPNYDGSETEPVVLPSRVPNLLINGSSGIAVGMATSIPPHSITEVINACLVYLNNNLCSIDDLIECIPAPDFPTAGLIYGLAGIHEGYRTGRGRVVMRAKTHTEDLDKLGTRKALIIDELPYQVNKRTLLEKIAELVNSKKLEGISDIRDESDKDGVRVVIELKRYEIADAVLNQLYKCTQMQCTFGINMVALVGTQPKLLNLREIIQHFVEHRREVIFRRTVFDLGKARERGHTLEGYAVALSNIDEIISLIKHSASRSVAQEALLNRLWVAHLIQDLLKETGDCVLHFGGPAGVGVQADGCYQFSATQAKAILDMQLSRLTGLEQEKIWSEYRSVVELVQDYVDILSNMERITQIISQELLSVRKEFSDQRCSEIVMDTADLRTEDFVTPQDMVVTFSRAGYIKSQPLSDYHSQKRGGRGKTATTTKDEDFIDYLFVANTHDVILCFSSLGRCYWLKVYEVPQGSRTSRGRPIVNLFNLKENEKVTAMLSVQDFSAERFVFMATSCGIVKKTRLSEFSNPRKVGIIAIHLEGEDRLIAAALTEGTHDVMLFSNAGKAVRFAEGDVREVGRGARGVRGMQLTKKQAVIAMLVANGEDLSVLTVTKNGYGKRTPISEYTRHGRGTKGMIAINQSERNGAVVGAALVKPADEIVLITELGVLIRVKVHEIREMSRSTQGVVLINLDEGDRLSGVHQVVESEHMLDE